MLENLLKWMTDSDTNLYFHRHLSAPAMFTDNSQVGVAICHPF